MKQQTRQGEGGRKRGGNKDKKRDGGGNCKKEGGKVKEEAKINRWSVSAHKCDGKLTRDQNKK